MASLRQVKLKYVYKPDTEGVGGRVS